MKKIYGKYFMKQKMMERVVLSLLPVAAASVWFFGLRCLVIMAVSVVISCIAEWLFVKGKGGKISGSAVVTGLIFALSLPPRTPFWIAAVGMVFGVVFGKMVFGGFGTNLFNPAIVGRAFVYISFSKPMNSEWTGLVGGAAGGFVKYIGPDIEAVSTATPLLAFRNAGETVSYLKLAVGNVSGTMGETSAVLILAAAIYLLATKTADWRPMAGMAAGFAALSLAFNMIRPGVAANPVYGVLAGSFMFTMVFIATEPISGAKTLKGKLLFGFLVGSVVAIIRSYALFTEGTTFAILIGNTFAPLIDEGVKGLERRTKKVEAS